jgi:hypothetical protein
MRNATITADPLKSDLPVAIQLIQIRSIWVTTGRLSLGFAKPKVSNSIWTNGCDWFSIEAKHHHSRGIHRERMIFV